MHSPVLRDLSLNVCWAASAGASLLLRTLGRPGENAEDCGRMNPEWPCSIGANHLHHHAAGWSCCINGFGQTAESSFLFLLDAP